MDKEDGHFIDDPLDVFGVKPDFEGMGIKAELTNFHKEKMTPEEFIRDYKRGYSNEIEDGLYEWWLTPDQAIAAVELAREQDKKVLEKLKELGQRMYAAAFNLTTDASHLRKTMEDWWHFVNYELKTYEFLKL